MIQLPKSVLSLAAGAVALGMLTLTAPKAAHALAATLVQITNTTADPAITQSTNMQASQLVELQLPGGATLEPGSGPTAMRQVSMPAGQSASDYHVPQGQNLVITGVDVNVYDAGGNVQIYIPSNAGSYSVSNAYLPNIGFQQIKYSSGLVAPSGSLVSSAFYSTAGAADVIIHGYLTAN